MDEDFLDVTAKPSKLVYILAILIIIILALLGYYFIFAKDNFTLKDRTIEAGTTLKTDVNYYIKKKGIDKSKVTLNLKKVNINKPGKYKISASYKGKVKYAYITVEDTTPPKFKTKKLVVEKGNHSFYLGEFLSKCEDVSKPCLVNYKNENDEAKLDKVGTYEITIVVSDVYNNEKDAKVTLEVVSEGEAPNLDDDEYLNDEENVKNSDSDEDETIKSDSDEKNTVRYKNNKDDREQEMSDFVD